LERFHLPTQFIGKFKIGSRQWFVRNMHLTELSRSAGLFLVRYWAAAFFVMLHDKGTFGSCGKSPT